jgi:cytochrome c oxidase subunit II
MIAKPLRTLALPAAALLLAGCDKTQNALAPKSHQARDIASLFWWMMGGAWIGLGLIVALLLWSRVRASKRYENEKAAWGVVLGLGIATPIVVMAAIFVIGDLFVIRTTEAPAANATRLTIRVTAHMWWWSVSYPGTSAVTANEIHIPARTPVRVEVQTADVIHSFWVPRLNRTIDAIPGRVNAIELNADTPGRYRGQCDEFCGLQHAHMAFYVDAEPPAVFRRWLAHEAKPATAKPPQAFEAAGCDSCHAIRGTDASSHVGPDLTHVASRTTLAALAIPNDRQHLRDWIVDAQRIKPGAQMPSFELPPGQVDSIVSYLERLR